jgi:hypothetical protein
MAGISYLAKDLKSYKLLCTLEISWFKAIPLGESIPSRILNTYNEASQKGSKISSGVLTTTLPQTCYVTRGASIQLRVRQSHKDIKHPLVYIYVYPKVENVI